MLTFPNLLLFNRLHSTSTYTFNASKNKNSTLCNNFSWKAYRLTFSFLPIAGCIILIFVGVKLVIWRNYTPDCDFRSFFFSQCRERILINMLKWNLIGSTTKFSRVGVPKTYAYNSTLSIIAIRVLVFLTFWFVWYCISVLPL